MNDKLIVALDVDNRERAEELVDILSPVVKIFKVGSVLFTRCGPSIIDYINSKDCRVFLDLKYHDIPNTVRCAIESAMDLGIFMLTVHIQGGREMLKAAIEAKKQKTNFYIVGITVLTSDAVENAKDEVLKRARIAHDSGLDGVVCSVHEAATVRNSCGEKFIIVTPGIRPKSYQSDDQKRIATAQEAIKAGANHIVVGRPIIQAKDPLAAAKEILKEIQ